MILISVLKRYQKSKFFYYSLVVLFFLLVFIFLFYNENQRLMFADGVFPYPSPNSYLKSFLNSWTEVRFGSPASFNPFHLLIYLVFLLTNSPVLSQQIIGILPFVLGSLFMFYFLRHTDFIESNLVSFLIALFYGFNSFTIKNLGGATSLNFTYAFLPLILLYSLRLLRCSKTDRFVNSLKLALSLTLASILNTQTIFLASFLVVFYIIFFTLFDFGDKKLKLKKFFIVLIYIILALSIYFLLTLPLNLYYLNLLFTNGSDAVAQGLKGEYFQTIVDAAPYIDTFPLLISPFLLLSGYRFSGYWLIFNILIIIFIVLSFLLAKNKIKKYFLVNLFIVLFYSYIMVVIIKYNKFANWLYDKFFPLKAFNSPPKWGYLLAIPLCLLIGLSITCFLSFLKNKKILKNLLIILFIIILFSGSFYTLYIVKIHFNSEDDITGQGGNHYVPFRAPEYNQEINEYLLSRRDIGDMSRAFWVPSSNYINYMKGNDDYSFIFPVNYVDLNNYLVRTFDKLPTKSFGIARALSLFDIKYVVVLKKMEQTWQPAIWYFQGMPQLIVGQPNMFIKFFNNQKGFEICYETENYIIYKIL